MPCAVWRLRHALVKSDFQQRRNIEKKLQHECFSLPLDVFVTNNSQFLFGDVSLLKTIDLTTISSFKTFDVTFEVMLEGESASSFPRNVPCRQSLALRHIDRQ